MQGNVNLPGQAIVESLLCLSFQRKICGDRVIIAGTDLECKKRW